MGNIRLIGEFFQQNIISTKIISECVDFLSKTIDDLNIRTLCELTKKICSKLHFEDPLLLENISGKLEEI